MEATYRDKSKEPQEGCQEEEHASHGFKQLGRDQLICKWKHFLHHNVERGEPK